MNTVPTPPAVQGSWFSRKTTWLSQGGWLLLVVTVVLPVLALAVELATGFCAELFFDPIPDIWHTLAVALVPAANLTAWLCARFTPPGGRWPAAFLTGLALGVSFYFSLLFLPIAVLGVIVFAISWWYFGFGAIGLLPLAPLFAFRGGLYLRRRLLQAYTGQPTGRLYGLRSGLCAGLLAVLALLSSSLITSAGLHLAASEDADRQAHGLRLLRSTGRRDLLLKACEPRNPVAGLHVLLLPGTKRLTTEEAMNLYYRVTGEDYREARAGMGSDWMPRRGRGEALEWDNDQGGTRIGGILKGLSLYGSRYEARADAAAGLAYAEWTLVFRNDHRAEREARARIALPPGGVVSRLTLWIDGEEREAAFGGRSQVRRAYEQVVRRRRDPVLVSTCGPDRIQVQCYPVPADGGEMKLRLGITAPLEVAEDGAAGTLPAPAIVERNFRIPRLQLELPQPLTLPLSPRLAASCRAEDTRGVVPGAVVQTAERAPAWRPRRVAIVVDGSSAMKANMHDVAKALDALPADLEKQLWFVDDAAAVIRPAAAATGDGFAEQASAVLKPARCTGGRCNLRTLQAAWDALCCDDAPAALVWVHGPQPFPMMSADDLCRRLARAPAGKRFYAVQIVPGTCKITEALDGVRNLYTLPPADVLADASQSLGRLFSEWSEGRTAWQIVRRRAAAGAGGAVDARAGDNLVRQWAAEEVGRLLVSGQAERREAARDLALAWSLVTPVSSAVVLETQQQYQQAGLEPVKGSSVPTVPEPSFWILLCVAVAVFAVWQTRQRRRQRAS